MALIEILPIIVFFASYKFKGILFATAALIISSILVILFVYVTTKKITKISLFSTIILVVFGAITLIRGDSLFIKIKPTILYLCFFFTLLYGIMKGKGLMRHVFGPSFEAPEEIWLKLSKKWAGFFLAMAVLNEVIWRNFSEEFWVNFKSFGLIPISLFFMAWQFPILKKYLKKND